MRRVTASANAPPSIAKPTSKSDNVLKLLLRTKGATPVELIAATGWQPHSMRAFLSGLRKKGRTIVREERKGGGYAYRIVGTPGAEPRAMTTSASALDRTSGIYPDGRSSPRTQNGAAPAADA
nr:DUF3489 domain-containing protein [Polymorphobacter sp.]